MGVLIYLFFLFVALFFLLGAALRFFVALFFLLGAALRFFTALLLFLTGIYITSFPCLSAIFKFQLTENNINFLSLP